MVPSALSLLAFSPSGPLSSVLRRRKLSIWQVYAELTFTANKATDAGVIRNTRNARRQESVGYTPKDPICFRQSLRGTRKVRKKHAFIAAGGAATLTVLIVIISLATTADRPLAAASPLVSASPTSSPSAAEEDLRETEIALLSQVPLLVGAEVTISGELLTLTLVIDTDEVVSTETITAIAAALSTRSDASRIKIIATGRAEQPLDLHHALAQMLAVDEWEADGTAAVFDLSHTAALAGWNPPADPSPPSPEPNPAVPPATRPKAESPHPPAPAPPPAAAAPQAPAPPPASGASEHDLMLSLVNKNRAEVGLAPVTISSALTAAATVQAQFQAANAHMTHDGNGGMGERVSAQGYPWRYVGENVAAGQKDVPEVFTAWANSPGHLANIRGQFTEMGLASARGTDGVLYWAQVFGGR